MYKQDQTNQPLFNKNNYQNDPEYNDAINNSPDSNKRPTEDED